MYRFSTLLVVSLLACLYTAPADAQLKFLKKLGLPIGEENVSLAELNSRNIGDGQSNLFSPWQALTSEMTLPCASRCCFRIRC